MARIALIGAGLPATVQAADTGALDATFGISPFGGYRVGGNFTDVNTNQTVDVGSHGSFALALDARADPGREYELFYSRQSTELSGAGIAPASIRIEYLHIGGTVVLDELHELEPRVQPYLAGGLGVTRLSPDSSSGQDDTRFSGSLALGLRVPLARHFLLRFEGRGYLTFMNTDAAIFCRSDQNGALCQIHAHSSTFFQFDFLAGASFVF